MATTKLSLYNGALTQLLGERRTTLTEDRPARYYLDAAYDDGFIDYVLEQGLWNFATRTVEIQASTSIAPGFGYQYAFERPTDYVRLVALSVDGYFNMPWNIYTDEAGYWFADVDTLYIQYISNDGSYGTNFSLWPQTMVKYAQAELADRVKEQITGNDGKYDRIKDALKKARVDARSKDAMNQPVRYAPSGSWVNSRRGGGGGGERGTGSGGLV